MTLRHGALYQPHPPDLPRFPRALAPVPIPNHFLHYQADGDALNNDRYGCCVPAADVQIARLWGARCDGTTVLNRYRQTGFDPATGIPDNGTPTADDMLNWAAAPILDLDGRPWPIWWRSVDHTDEGAIRHALARFPLVITLGLPVQIAQEPERWNEPPQPGWTADEGHRVVLGYAEGDVWWVRTWGIDYAVSPELMRLMLLTVDVPIPHPAGVPAELQLAGEGLTAVVG